MKQLPTAYKITDSNGHSVLMKDADKINSALPRWSNPDVLKLYSIPQLMSMLKEDGILSPRLSSYLSELE